MPLGLLVAGHEALALTTQYGIQLDERRARTFLVTSQLFLPS